MCIPILHIRKTAVKCAVLFSPQQAFLRAQLNGRNQKQSDQSNRQTVPLPSWSLLFRTGMEIFFSVKTQIIKILGFGGHRVSSVATQLCSYTMRAILDNMYRNECGHVPTQLYKSECHARIGLWVVICQLQRRKTDSKYRNK